jgi:hypothetical protein
MKSRKPVLILEGMHINKYSTKASVEWNVLGWLVAQYMHDPKSSET